MRNARLVWCFSILFCFSIWQWSATFTKRHASKRCFQAEAEEFAEKLLQLVGLADKRQLSNDLSGVKKKEWVLLVHLRETLYFITDEYLRLLDPELVDEVLDVIRNNCERRSFYYVCLVNHENVFAREIADRVSLLW